MQNDNTLKNMEKILMAVGEACENVAANANQEAKNNNSIIIGNENDFRKAKIGNKHVNEAEKNSTCISIGDKNNFKRANIGNQIKNKSITSILWKAIWGILAATIATVLGGIILDKLI